MGVTVKISLDKGQVVPTQSVILNAMAAAMRETARMVADEARLDVRVRTGKTRQSIHALPVERLPNGVRGGVAANDIGRYLEHGTATFSDDPNVRHAKYPILPVRKKALAWASAQGPSSMMTGSGRPLSYVESGSHRSQHPPITGQYVRLTGAVRAPIQRMIVSGAIPWGSVYTIRRGVMHPGIRPRPFMRPALERIMPMMPEIVLAELRKAMG